MAVMGDAALSALWGLFKERIAGYEAIVKTDEQADNTLTVTVRRQGQSCFGIVVIPANNTTDTLTLPEGFRPLSTDVITGEDFSVTSAGEVSINSAEEEDRTLLFFYHTGNSLPDAAYKKGDA